MPNLFLILVIAFVIIVFSIALLAIGWLITGKSKIGGGCGRAPHQSPNQDCGSCETCKRPFGDPKP